MAITSADINKITAKIDADKITAKIDADTITAKIDADTITSEIDNGNSDIKSLKLLDISRLIKENSYPLLQITKNIIYGISGITSGNITRTAIAAAFLGLPPIAKRFGKDTTHTSAYAMTETVIALSAAVAMHQLQPNASPAELFGLFVWAGCAGARAVALCNHEDRKGLKKWIGMFATGIQSASIGIQLHDALTPEHLDALFAITQGLCLILKGMEASTLEPSLNKAVNAQSIAALLQALKSNNTTGQPSNAASVSLTPQQQNQR